MINTNISPNETTHRIVLLDGCLSSVAGLDVRKQNKADLERQEFQSTLYQQFQG